MNAAHTPTPRTDNFVLEHDFRPSPSDCLNFCVKLERELFEANEATKRAKSYKRVLKDENARLRRELTEAQDRIDDLTATGIHSCGTDCKRPNCVLRRELAELRSKYRDHYEEAERLTREITDSRRSVKYSQDLITTLRCEKDEVIDQRDALAAALRGLMFDCLRFRIEPSDDAYKNAESSLATLEGRGSNPAQKSPLRTP